MSIVGIIIIIYFVAGENQIVCMSNGWIKLIIILYIIEYTVCVYLEDNGIVYRKKYTFGGLNVPVIGLNKYSAGSFFSSDAMSYFLNFTITALS